MGGTLRVGGCSAPEPFNKYTYMPKSLALRKGRVSIPGQTYAITKCCGSNYRRIIADPYTPDASKESAQVIIDSLQWMHREGRARCYGYVIMPDHLHAMLQLGNEMSLSDVLRTFSSFTTHVINKQNRWSGAFWQKGFYDHGMRTNESYDRHLEYFAENPARKGYVSCIEQWPFSEVLPGW